MKPTFEHAVLRALVRTADGRIGRLWSLPGERSDRPARVEIGGELIQVSPTRLELAEAGAQ